MDNFYTADPSVFIPYINKYITNDDILIEPSCGDGAFLKYFKFSHCYDIEKKTDNENFKCMDFLKVDNIAPYSCYIGNPPFGKNSKLAIDFCKHCCKLQAKYIMFILPEVFKQDKYKSIAFNKSYHLKEEIDYKDFIKDGKKVSVNCVFQIWKLENEERQITTQNNKPIKNKYFKYITKSRLNTYTPNEYTFSIRRVGSKTTELTKGVHNSLEDHFIIELYKEYDLNDFIEKYNNFKFVISPSTKQKHITKSLLDEQVNELNIRTNKSIS